MRIHATLPMATLLGLAGTLGAMKMAGSYPNLLLHTPSMLLVFGAAIGGTIALRGGAALRLFVATIRRYEGDSERSAELLDAAEVLERMSLLGGLLGMAGGVGHAVGSFYTPEQIGPGIHLALASLLCSVLLNTLLVLPLKQQLLTELDPSDRLSGRAATIRALRVFGSLAIALALLLLFQQRTDTFGTTVALVPLLCVAAALLPSALASSEAPWSRPISSRRLSWHADAVIYTATVPSSFAFMHAMCVLDSPKLVPPALGLCITMASLPIAGALVLRVCAQHPTPRTQQVPATPARMHAFAFAAFAFAALFGMSLLAWLAAQQDPTAAATPR